MSEELDARSVAVLLRVVQSQDERFRETRSLAAFMRAYPDIGRHVGSHIVISGQDKRKIAAILGAEGIDPATPPDAWRGKSRIEALAYGNDEKLAGSPVRARRIAIKSLRPAQPVHIGGETVALPARCHIEIDDTLASLGGHDWVVVVENWESFNDIHVAADRLAFPGQAPLVVWRGDSSRTRAHGADGWIEKLGLPVAAFVDFDPKGLSIALALPRLDLVVAPEPDSLRALLRDRGLTKRYFEQVPYCRNQLDTTTHPQVRALWQVILAEGRGLPQEWFSIGEGVGNVVGTSRPGNE